MKIGIFTFCDFASLYGEKLCVMGSTDQIGVPQVPANKSGFIVARIHLERGDEGTHTFVSSIIDKDGHPIFKSESKLSVAPFKDEPQEDEVRSQYKMDSFRFQVLRFGEHALELRDNGNILISIPMIVYLQKNKPQS